MGILGLPLQVLSFLWEQKEKVYYLLRVLTNRRLVLFVVLALSAGSIGFLLEWLSRSEKYEDVVAKVLKIGEKEGNDTPLTSLLLSGVNTDALKIIKSERLDSDFKDLWNTLVRDARSPISSKVSEPVRLVSGALGSEALTEFPASSQCGCSGNGSDSSPGFLFAPYFLFQPPLKSGDEQRVIDSGAQLEVYSREVPAARAHDDSTVRIASPTVFGQVAVSKLISASMQKLAGTPMIGKENSEVAHVSPVPVQAYAVMAGGLMRAFVHDDPHPTKFYGNQFPPTTFFPSRPYFWPTFRDQPSFYSHIAPMRPFQAVPSQPEARPQPGSEGDSNGNSSMFAQEIASESTIGEFFRVSEPYLDLGGNGVIVTLTRGLIIDEEAKLVICLDLRINDDRGLTQLLGQKLIDLEGRVDELKCIVSKGSQDLSCDDGNKSLKNNQELYIEAKNEFLRSPTAVLSNLHRFDSGSTVRFSIPVERTINEDGSQRLTLMLGSFDLKTYKQVTQLYALAAASSFGTLTSILFYLWGSVEVGHERFKKALSGVDEVMEQCPTPYLRLDEKDGIVFANSAFKHRIHDPDVEKQKLEMVTLRSLCADPASKQTYDEVEGKRKRGEAVAPYNLNLIGPGNTTVAVTVHSAAVPSEIRNSLPGTFGIMLENAPPGMDESAATGLSNGPAPSNGADNPAGPESQ